MSVDNVERIGSSSVCCVSKLFPSTKKSVSVKVLDNIHVCIYGDDVEFGRYLLIFRAKTFSQTSVMCTEQKGRYFFQNFGKYLS